MNSTTYSTQGSLANDLVEIVVILYIVLMRKVELLWVELDTVVLVW